jgi:hypothetical protein
MPRNLFAFIVSVKLNFQVLFETVTEYYHVAHHMSDLKTIDDATDRTRGRLIRKIKPLSAETKSGLGLRFIPL